MEIHEWMVIVLAFLAGGGMGVSGILVSQWLVGKFDVSKERANAQAMRRIRGDMMELDNQVTNIDARLDFTEKLLGGALTVSPAPARQRPERSDDPEVSDRTEDPDRAEI